MKRFAIVSGVVIVAAVISVTVVLAFAPHRRGWFHHGERYHGPLSYLAHELNLSGTQRSQVKSIWQGERPRVSSLVREFAAESKEMDTATEQHTFDESKVQEIANRQGATVAKFLVEKERLKSQIYTTVLNPEQRAKADALEKRWHSRLYRIAAG